MATEVRLPELGENLEGGEVLELKASPGDMVNEGQTLLEIEAEKSTLEVPAPLTGRLTQLVVKKGDQVSVGQTLCFIEGAENKESSNTVSDEGKKVAKSVPTEKHSGPIQTRDEPEASSEDERPDSVDHKEPEVSSVGEAGKARKPEGDGQSKDEIAGKGTASPTALPPTKTTGKMVPAGPATRRLARELGVELHKIQGTARGGRVTPEDVKSYVQRIASNPSSTGGHLGVPPLHNFEQWGPIERHALDPIRRRTAEQMSLAWRLIPHVTHYDQADITELDGFRRQQEKGGPKLTVTAFALKAASIVLKEFPKFNASIDMADAQLIFKHYYHIGVAVDTERGLLVPVIHDVDKKSVQELAQELVHLAERARQKKIASEEMKGGSFTITNLGGIGGTGFSPIVNYPEVAILGLARGHLQPVIREGQVLPRLILPLSLSYDHRIIDGADAARFTRRFAEMLESPLLIMLHA